MQVITRNVSLTSNSLATIIGNLKANDKHDIQILNCEWMFDVMISGRTEVLVENIIKKLDVNTVVIFENITAIEDTVLAEMTEILDVLVNHTVIATLENCVENDITNLFIN
jgi:hypothetical protein